MGAAQLERQYRQSYAFDARNSGIERVRNSEAETGFHVRSHYSLGRVAQAGGGGGAAPSLPGTVPDPRSLFLGFYWGFSRLPEPMRARGADPRVGYFTAEVADRTRTRAARPTATSPAGGWRRKTRPRPCLNRASPSCTGWTATFRWPIARS